jgi:hypothetical protein
MENNSLETCDLGVTPKPFLRRRPEETAESIVDLLSRGVSVAGIAAREDDGVARKWRRKDLKRLNPRPELVWPRKLRTHKMWSTGAQLTVRGSGLQAVRKLHKTFRFNSA